MMSVLILDTNGCNVWVMVPFIATGGHSFSLSSKPPRQHSNIAILKSYAEAVGH